MFSASARNHREHVVPEGLKYARGEEEDPWWASVGSTRSSAPVGTHSPQGNLLIPVKKWTLVITGAIVISAFGLSAQLDALTPVFLVSVLMGAAVVAAPLWRSRVGWRVALTGWLIACTASLVLHFTSTAAQQIVCLLALAIVVGAWIVRFHAEFRFMPEEEWQWRSTVRAIGAFLAITIGTLLAGVSLMLTPSQWHQSVTSTAQWAILLAAAGFAVATVIVAAMAGLSLVGALSDPRKVAKPQRRHAPTYRVPELQSYSPGFGDAVRRAALVMAARIHHSSKVVAIGIGNFWGEVYYLCRLAGCTVVNFIAAALEAMRKTFKYGRNFALTAGRVVLVPAIAISVAGWLALVWSEQELEYLMRGSFASLAISIGAAIGSAIFLCVAWMALSGRSVDESLKAAQTSTLNTIPALLFLIAIGGWILGIPGTLGYGNIHVGWVTSAATLILIAGGLWGQFNKNNEQDGPSTSTSPTPTRRAG